MHMWRIFGYHYNVADVRLAQHIEKGNEYGLLSSSVGSCSNLWALIMDGGTGFTSQVYLLSLQFLHKVAHQIYFCIIYCYAYFHTFFVSLQEWILDQWEKSYYISAVAGSNNGEGIHTRWDVGYRITATATTFDHAAFVLSVPRRKPADETHETLRTSAFPSTHVKENGERICILLQRVMVELCRKLKINTCMHFFGL